MGSQIGPVDLRLGELYDVRTLIRRCGDRNIKMLPSNNTHSSKGDSAPKVMLDYQGVVTGYHTIENARFVAESSAFKLFSFPTHKSDFGIS
jgi:hypothetical protein